MANNVDNEEIIEKRPSHPVATSCLILAAVGMIGAFVFQIMEVSQIRAGMTPGDPTPYKSLYSKNYKALKGGVDKAIADYDTNLQLEKFDAKAAPPAETPSEGKAEEKAAPPADTKAEEKPADAAGETKDEKGGTEKGAKTEEATPPAETKDEPKDAPKDEPKADASKDEPKDEPKADAPKEEPAKEEPAGDGK